MAVTATLTETDGDKANLVFTVDYTPLINDYPRNLQFEQKKCTASKDVSGKSWFLC